MGTEEPPVAICTVCGDTTYQLERIDSRCGRKPGGKRCKGIYGSALNNGDWAKCIACDGVGRFGNAGSCSLCQGTGWSFVRNRRHR
jgi:hypothetical protein